MKKSYQRDPKAGAASRLALLAAFLLAFAPGLAADESAPPKPAGGLSYHHDEIAKGPWSIHVVKVDRSNPEFQLHSMMANGNRFGLTALSEQLRQLPAALGRPVAAVNGDFYDNESPYEGDPKGLQIVEGELVSAPANWTCLWVDASGHPQMGVVVSQLSAAWPGGETFPLGLNERRPPGAAVLYSHAVGSSTHTIGGRELVLEKAPEGKWLPLQPGESYTARVREIREAGDTPLGADTLVLSLGPDLARQAPKLSPGALLKISTATAPSLRGATMAIGGGPSLIHGGKIQTHSTLLRHPRSAIGWNRDFLYLVEVDGRQPTLSVGMDYAELSAYMAKLGCDEAMNLDGGGSSTLWVLGHVINSPCEGRERGVANGLVIVQKPKADAKPLSSHAEPKN